MMRLLDMLHHFVEGNWVEQVGWVLLHSLWQITLIAVIYWLLSFLLGKGSAFSRYLVGCAALALMLVAPIATFCLLPSQQVAIADSVEQDQEVASLSQLSNEESLAPAFVASDNSVENLIDIEPAPADQGVSTGATYTAPAEVPSMFERISSAVRPWLPVITACWLIGVMLLLMRPVIGCLYVRRLKRFGLSPVPDSVLVACRELMQKMNVRHAVQCFQSSVVRSPVVVGYLRPMILLPASAVTGLTACQLELILAHELAHIRKHDYLVNLVQTVIEALLFYHPGMWWVTRQVRRERENCCDDVAVAIRGDRATYIRALALLEGQRVSPPALAATGGSLLGRVRRLVEKPESEFGYRKSSLWLTALIMVGVALTTIAFANTPSDQRERTEDSMVAVENEDGEETAESSALNFDKLVGQKVAQVVRDAKLPFVDDRQLEDIEKDFTSFMNSNINYGTYTVGSSIPEDQRKAIFRAVEEHGAQHLRLDRFRQKELRSINWAYLGLPDRLLTLKWKLHRAIINARTLDKDKQAKLESQRLWMKQHVRSLPVAHKSYTHARALSELEERFADPLACTLGYPMTDGQFDAFKRELQKYTGKSELGHAVSHIVQQSLEAQYRDSTDFELPFKDRVGSYGAGRVVHLGFMSNRPFDSSLRCMHEIETSHTVVDATTGYLLTAPKKSREPDDFRRWLSKEGRGDFGYDDANGGGLISVRGAKLVELDVETWHEADAISDKQLRALLNGPSASDTVPLKKHNQDPFQDAPYCYVGVLTKEGRLAVVAVEGFSRNSVDVRTRARPVPPEKKPEELPDNWGEATEGVQLRIHSLDVQFVDGQWRVQCKTDIRSSEERVLPHYGAPIGEYEIEWNGKWYRPVWSISASSLGPSRALNRNSMNTQIEAHGWVDKATGKPLLLSAGTHALRIALPLVDPLKGAENQHLQKRAISNKIDVTVPAKEPDRVTWGPENNGLQLGIAEADIQAMRNWVPDSKLSYRLWIKNASEQPMSVTDFIPLRGWYPELRDKDGKRVALPMPPIERPVQIRERWLAGGAIAEVGQLSIDLPVNFKPGANSLKQVYRITTESQDQFPLEVSVDTQIGERAQPDHTLRIEGDRLKAGTVSGKVKGGFGTYSVHLEHDDWKSNLGDLPQLLVKSGETFQFTNVPVGECVVTAQSNLVFNLGKHQKARLSTTVEVKDARTATADLIVNKLRWDRLKPNNEHARVMREWDSISYEKARAIGINETSDLPEIWIEVPAGSKSYEIRKDVRVTNATFDTTIYERPDLNQFWVQRDPPESSSHTFFGPFDGKPTDVLVGKAASQEVADTPEKSTRSGANDSSARSELVISRERGGEVSREETVYVLDNELVTLDQLQERLKEKLKNDPKLMLMIRAAPEHPLEEVMTAMQLAKAAGVVEFSMAMPKEPTSHLQPWQRQLLLDIQNACREHLMTMPPSEELSARARSIDHARLQIIAHHTLNEKAIALLQVGGPEQVDPGSNARNNKLLWCCQCNRNDKAPANGGWTVTDTQVVPSLIKYRALEIAFAWENRSPYPPGSTKSRRAIVVGPDGAGLPDVLVKAFVFGKVVPVLVAKADRKGDFLLPNSPPGVEPPNDQGAIRRGYRLEFSKPGYLPWEKHIFVNFDADGNYDRQAFLMRKSTVVSGKLLGVDGKPLAGKKVQLRSITLNPDTRFEDAYDLTETKADGSFRFENIWPGRHLVQSWHANDQEKNDPAKGRTAAVIVETSDFKDGKLTVDDVVLDLSKSSNTLAVTLLDQDGQPVPEAEVEILWRPLVGHWGGGRIFCSLLGDHFLKVKTNTEGKATLTGLPPGSWEVRVDQRQLHENYLLFASERITFEEGDQLEATLQFSKPLDLDDFESIFNIR